jgi:hypothetical protein
MSFGHWPASNILALYRLADVNDASGNSHTLTNVGPVTFGAGKFGNCALFGSANNGKYLLHSDSFGKDLSGEACISVWFLIQTLPTSGEPQYIARWASTNGTSRYFNCIYINDSGTKKLRMECSGYMECLDYTVDLITNIWYKLDFNIAATCEAFLNGASIGTYSRSTATTPYNLVAIGSYYSSDAAYFFKGNIDEAIFFNAARTAADIRRRYAFERGMLV